MLPVTTIPTTEYLEYGSCVYKLYYGDKYIIAKGKTLAGSLYLIEKGYAYFLSYEHKREQGKNSLYFNFYTHMKNNPGLEFKVQVILESSNTYALLKAEQVALDEAIKDKKCVNNNVEAYVPKYRPKTKMHGDWIPHTAVMNFRRFQKRV